MSIDASSLIVKVIERAVDKCGQASPLAALGSVGPQGEELVVESLATQLLAFLGLGSGALTEQTGGDVLDQAPPSGKLIERNRNLARALGACECWGQLRDCTVCHGHGRPGWTLPYKPLFDRIVRPALRAISEHRLVSENRGGSRLRM